MLPVVNQKDRDALITLGKFLNDKRKAQKLTGKELAIKTGISRETLSHIMKGKTNFTFVTLINITQALDIKFDFKHRN